MLCQPSPSKPASFQPVFASLPLTLPPDHGYGLLGLSPSPGKVHTIRWRAAISRDCPPLIDVFRMAACTSECRLVRGSGWLG